MSDAARTIAGAVMMPARSDLRFSMASPVLCEANIYTQLYTGLADFGATFSIAFDARLPSAFGSLFGIAIDGADCPNFQFRAQFVRQSDLPG